MNGSAQNFVSSLHQMGDHIDMNILGSRFSLVLPSSTCFDEPLSKNITWL